MTRNGRAVWLVFQGRHPHEITIDLISAEIRQGSRTTINDELPPVVADTMGSLWVVAVRNSALFLSDRGRRIQRSRRSAELHFSARTQKRYNFVPGEWAVKL